MTFIKILTLIGLPVAVWLTGRLDFFGGNPGHVTAIATLEAKNLGNQHNPDPRKLFTKSDADKIMGQSTHLADSSSKMERLSDSYLCAYKTDVKDITTGKIGAIYFLFEKYKLLSDAKKRYTDIMLANKPHGIKNIENLGDEAYFHTDSVNFYFIMVRKGNYVYNIKVNKIISTTSLKEFNNAANKIAVLIRK